MTNFFKSCYFKHSLTNFSKLKTIDSTGIIVEIRVLEPEEFFSELKNNFDFQLQIYSKTCAGSNSKNIEA